MHDKILKEVPDTATKRHALRRRLESKFSGESKSNKAKYHGKKHDSRYARRLGGDWTVK